MVARFMPYAILLVVVSVMLFSSSPFMATVQAIGDPVPTPTPKPTPTPTPKTEGGCTPGYWKQEHHFDSWVGFTPGQSLQSAGFVFPASLASFNSVTLLNALQGGGGSGLAGATQILMRAAVAALLNASNSSVGFGLSVTDVRSATNSALASQDRTTILNLAARLDTLNNTGCPLN